MSKVCISALFMKELKLSKENPAKTSVVKKDFHKAMAIQMCTCEEFDTFVYKFIRPI